eukprot:357921-Chlamydomonas_euryale.AAC.4
MLRVVDRNTPQSVAMQIACAYAHAGACTGRGPTRKLQRLVAVLERWLRYILAVGLRDVTSSTTDWKHNSNSTHVW